MNATDTTVPSRGRPYANFTSIPYPEPPDHLLVATTAFYVIIFLLGIGGNLLVLLVFLSCRSLRTFINFLFLNLCLADFLVLLISGPTAVLDIYAMEVWYLGGVMCKTVPFVENMVANASILSILAVSIERYRVASRPLSQHGGSCNAAVKTMVMIWVISAAVASPILFITKYKSALLLDGTSVKVCKTTLHLSWHKIYVLLSTVLFFLVPFVVLVFLYSKMCLRVLSSRRSSMEEIPAQMKEVNRLKRQLLLIVLTVVLAFFLCQTPYRAIVLWMLFDTTKSVRNLGFVGYLSLIYFTRILLYLNHAINPFLYNFVSRKFRRALTSMCCRTLRRKSFNDFRDGRNRNFAVEIQNRLGCGQLRSVEHRHCLSPRHRHRHRQNDFLMLYENLIE
ncbi:growth hormone secretagogue receptor type 1-like [Haliotis asinina]|uniref:growth hormone secretagogue receptor type 1-like n=1 Tax=Haliotis asinina TaxID=109174 RepID=UPI0035321750